MMDKIDFELCLDVKELAAKSHCEKLEATSPSMCEQNKSMDTRQNSIVSGAETGTIRTWEQIDQTLDGSERDGPSNNEASARKRARISTSGSLRNYRDYNFMNDTQGDWDMADPQDATFVEDGPDSTQQLYDRVGSGFSAVVSADDDNGHDDPSFGPGTGGHPVSSTIGISSATNTDIEQSRLPLTPLLLGPPGSNYSMTTRKGTLITSSPRHHRPEKTTERTTQFTIYEDPGEPEDTDMDTTDIEMDSMNIDYDDDSTDDPEDPQQLTSHENLSDDKENADESYDDDDDDDYNNNYEQRTELQRLGTRTRTETQNGIQISFEAETESDTETVIQEHALTRHIGQDTIIAVRVDGERESDSSIEASVISESEQDDGDNIANFFEDDDSTLLLPSAFYGRHGDRRRSIITNDSSSNDDYNSDNLSSTTSPRTQTRTPWEEIHASASSLDAPLDSSSVGPGSSTSSVLFSGSSTQTGSVLGQHLRPSSELGLGQSTLSPSSSSSMRRRRRPYRPRAFN